MLKFVIEDVKIVGVTTIFLTNLCFRCEGMTTVDAAADEITVCESMQFMKDAKKTVAAKFTVATPRGELQDIWV